jgi:hypothetical protein
MAATFATPFGLASWRYALLLAREIGPAGAIVFRGLGELTPTLGQASRSGFAFWFYAVLLAGATVGTVLLLLRRRMSAERFLIVLAMGAVSLTGRRNMVLFALVGAPYCAELLRVLQPGGIKIRQGWLFPPAMAMLVMSWFPLSGDYYYRMFFPTRFGLGATPSFFPQGLPAFLQRIGFRGQVFNSNSLGGYYLYHRYPTGIPLTDGRWEIYDPAVLQMILESPGLPFFWSKVLETYDIRGILLQHVSPEATALLPHLSRDPRWRLVYLDYAASFWIPRDASAIAEAIDLSKTVLLPEPSAIFDCMMLDSFLRGVQAGEARIANLRRALSFGRSEEFILEQIGLEQARLGRMGDADETFRTLRSRFPRNEIALSRTGPRPPIR